MNKVREDVMSSLREVAKELSDKGLYRELEEMTSRILLEETTDGEMGVIAEYSQM